MGTCAVTPIALGDSDVPDFLAYKADGEQLRYFRSKKLVQRVSSDGIVAESMKFPRQVTNLAFTTNGVHYNSETAIFFWPFGHKESQPVILAGSSLSSGDQDGTGRRARFCRLRRPCFGDSRYIFVRDCPGGDDIPSRLVRIDMRTDEVRSCNVHGFPFPSEFMSMCPMGEHLFLLDSNRRLLRASVHGQSGPLCLGGWCAMDLTELVQPIAFRLKDGSVLHFDARILKAGSEYFLKMLTSGCCEAMKGEVDLTGDQEVSRTSLEIVLRFIATGDLLITSESSDSSIDCDQLFEVRTLADRYQLLGLQDAVEARLCRDLIPENVLLWLGKVLGSDGKLERACWRLLDNQREEVMEKSESFLSSLLQRHPELGKVLLMRTCGKRRKT